MRVLLLSNTMLFKYCFSSLYKDEYKLDRKHLRYFTLSDRKYSDNAYIQMQEQRRLQLMKKGLLLDPYRVVVTPKLMRNLIKLIEKNQYKKVIYEMKSSSTDEFKVLNEILRLGVDVDVYVDVVKEDFYHMVDIENSKLRLRNINDLLIQRSNK